MFERKASAPSGTEAFSVSAAHAPAASRARPVDVYAPPGVSTKG